jgi:hypothetical protein
MQLLPTFCGDRYVEVRGSEAGRSWIKKDVYVLCYARIYMLDTEGCKDVNVLCHTTCVMVCV